MSDPQAVFRALSDPTRRDIITMLNDEGEKTVSQIASEYAMTRPGVSKHLGVLQDADLIQTEKRGRETYNSLNREPLKAATDWMNFYSGMWENKLSGLDLGLDLESELNGQAAE